MELIKGLIETFHFPPYICLQTKGESEKPVSQFLEEEGKEILASTLENNIKSILETFSYLLKRKFVIKVK